MKSHLTLLPILISLSALFLVSCPDPSETPETPGFTVYYHANGADGGTVPAAQTKEPGVPLLLSDNTGNLYRDGYYFNGWNTRADGEGAYYGGEVSYYYADAPINLYAWWVAVPEYTVSYYSNGANSGSVPASLSLYAKWDVDGFVGEDDSYPVITDFSFRKSVINEAEKKEDIVFTITTRCENTL